MRKQLVRNLVMVSAFQLFAQSAEINWKTDYESAIEESRETGKIIHLHFWTSW